MEILHEQPGQPTLFGTTLRDRFVFHYTQSRPYWPEDSRLTLDFITEDPVSVPFLREIGITWCAPCHAMISLDNEIIATLSGILTFDSWSEKDEHSDFFDLEDPYSEPLLVCLSSSHLIEDNKRQHALENALGLVYGFECGDAQELLSKLARIDDWSR